MQDLSQNKFQKNKKAFFAFFLFILFVFLGAILFFISLTYFKNTEFERAKNRVSLYRSTLVGELERFQHLPFILAKDPFVIAGAKGLEREKLSKRLASFALKSNLDAIYLMDIKGLTIASSNYKDEVNFLGQNYGFRPYFKNALKGKRGEFFGIGATTLLPGYFVAQLVRGEYGQPLGVIAIKLDLSKLSNAWSEGGEMVFVSNSDGVVVLSSNKNWRYKTIFPISQNRRKEITKERQFANEKLLPLDWKLIGKNSVELDGQKFIHALTSVSRLGWNLHFLAPENRALERAWFTVIIAAIIAVSLLALILILRSERIKSALKISQADRKKLRQANAKLAQEIVVRRAAEKRLKEAQVELARSSKLAALGQLSASVTHELGQPISAMQNYLTAAEFDKDEAERKATMTHLSGIVKRMINITKQLRFFAKPIDSDLELVDLRKVWQGAKILVMPDIKQAGISLKINLAKKPVMILANRLRLEQVLVNLIRNSMAAMEDCSTCEIEITIEKDENFGIIKVRDSGHGLGENSLEKLKEPFHTTRASGNGMGLGLAISAAIISEHDGKMTAENAKEGGAVFIIKIPIFVGEDNE